MDQTSVVIAASAFLAVAALAYGLLLAWESRQPDGVERRLRELTGGRTLASVPGLLKDEELALELRAKLRSVSRALLTLNHLFEQAGTRLSLPTFLGLSFAAAATAFALAVVVRAPAPLLPLATAGGGLLPLLWLLARRRRRIAAFAEQLPDALEMLGRALRAGNSVPAAIRIIADESLPPLSREFGMVAEAMNLGRPVDQALEDLETRIPNRELRFFTTCLRIQQRSGGNLSEILDKISRTVKDRFRMQGHVQALTAEGRMTGAILLLLTPAVFLAIYYLNPAYVAPLLKDEVGRKMAAATVALQFVGAAAIRKIIAIKI